MSSMNFSTSKQYVRPPQRGIFQLDHDSECKPFIEKYLACLNDSNDMHHKCKELSKDYLQCRMDRKLMSEENLDDVSAVEIACSVHGVEEALIVRKRFSGRLTDFVWFADCQIYFNSL